MKARHLIKEAVVATFIITTIVIPLSFIPFKSEFVKPIKQELDDFDVYDLIYSGKASTHPGSKDPNIIIVQAANERSRIAEQVNKIRSLEPAVIGVDLSFEGKKEIFGDLLLQTEILKDSLVVPGYTLDHDTVGKTAIKENFFQKDFLLHQGGFMNLPYQDSFSVIRSFTPFYKEKDTEYYSFSVRIADRFSHEKVEKLRKRHNDIEMINYYGNIEYYISYTADKFEEYFQRQQLRDFKGKIILLGFFSDEDSSRKQKGDIFLSPLNEKIKGKRFPDMYGVVLHANILSMISGRDYITVLPVWMSFVIGFFIAFALNCFILLFYSRYKHPYHILFFLIQIPLLILLVFLFIKFYDWFNLRISLLPIVLEVVLAVEFFDLYKMFAKYLGKHYTYKTIFLN